MKNGSNGFKEVRESVFGLSKRQKVKIVGVKQSHGLWVLMDNGQDGLVGLDVILNDRRQLNLLRQLVGRGGGQ